MKNSISDLIKEIFAEVNKEIVKILNFKNNEKKLKINEEKTLINNNSNNEKKDNNYIKEDDIINVTNFKEERIDYTEFKNEKTEIINNWKFELDKTIWNYYSELKIPILVTSSIQVERDNDYGKSKLEGENLLREYSKKNNVPVYIYRLPNVFGKWCRPNYNSVIATWCNNIANDLDIIVSDRAVKLSLVYIDDVVNTFSKHLTEKIENKEYYTIPTIYEKSLGEILDILYSFKNNRNNLIINKVGTGFERALYSTYLSYLPKDKFSYELTEHKDNRGAFVEIIKTFDSGQFSISTSKPGITRGNHYHNTKNEKFLVIKGEAIIRFRHIYSDEVIEYPVSDKKLEVVDIPVGYTHNITNTGDSEMILVIWANELFDKKNPDTYFLEV